MKKSVDGVGGKSLPVSQSTPTFAAYMPKESNLRVVNEIILLATRQTLEMN